MPSSTSSSEPAGAGQARRWRRFFVAAIATAAGLGAVLYGFVAIVDPWDVLPLSPPWQRAPMSSNQRYSYAALASNHRFDSAVIGTSTSRLLRPADLDSRLGGTFVNLSMNAATPYEQSRMLSLFARTHAGIGTVILGINYGQWCETTPDQPKYMYLSFPEWMYDGRTWRSYGHVFSLYALQEAMAQVAYWAGVRRPRFGFDGYANFLPADSRYDAVRARAGLGTIAARGPVTDTMRDRPDLRFPSLDRMRDMLGSLPTGTRKIVFFAPTYLGNRPVPGSPAAAPLAACKFRVAEIARHVANTTVIDFLIDSPITSEAANYWDHLHYRIGIAERLVADLARALADARAPSPDYRVLVE